MITPFFNTPLRQAQFNSVARSWIGTPFHPHASVRGAGVDCVHLLGSIYVETGLLETFTFPKYALDGGSHSDSSLIIEWLKLSRHFQSLGPKPEAILIGDLLIFSLGKSAWHVGTYLGVPAGTFVHALETAGVVTSSYLEHPWGRRLTGLYRPIAQAVTGGAR